MTTRTFRLVTLDRQDVCQSNQWPSQHSANGTAHGLGTACTSGQLVPLQPAAVQPREEQNTNMVALPDH